MRSDKLKTPFLLTVLLVLLSSCKGQMDATMASTYSSQLTPEERNNPRISDIVDSASNLDLDGVRGGLDRVTDPPGDGACPPSGLSFNTTVLPASPRVNQDNTPFEQLSSNGSKTPIRLWATNYYTPVYNGVEGAVPLKEKNERTIHYKGKEVGLSHRKWCMAAMEGSVSIRMHDGVTKTFNYSGVGNMQTDCTKYFRGRHRATGRVKFKEVESAWGMGVKNYSLIPYRTIAVDPNVIPYGSVVFIEDAVGKEITLSDGTTFTHDGYFFAGDTGGAIKNKHIDVFTGNNKNPNLNFIKSTSSGRFNAAIVNDPELIAKMDELHRRKY